MELIKKADRFAFDKHLGQMDDTGKPYFTHPGDDTGKPYFTHPGDDTGKPYFTHPGQVYRILLEVAPQDENLLCAALLHDTIEDTETTYEELVEEFNQDVADLVNEVTHDGAKDNYGLYFPRLKTQRGILLKFADRLSNLSRMENWNEERKAHYLRKSKFWKDGSDRVATYEQVEAGIHISLEDAAKQLGIDL